MIRVATADDNSKTACQRDTQYQIGSITKQFTAVAVLKTLHNLARMLVSS